MQLPKLLLICSFFTLLSCSEGAGSGAGNLLNPEGGGQFNGGHFGHNPNQQTGRLEDDALNLVHNPAKRLWNPIIAQTTELVGYACAVQENYNTLTGTLTVQGNNWQYNPNPTDALIINDASGTRLVTFAKLEVPNCKYDYNENHDVRYVVARSQEHMLTVFDIHDANGNMDYAKGYFDLTGKPAMVDVRDGSGGYVDSDNTGLGARSDHTLTGTYQEPRFTITFKNGTTFNYQSHGGKTVVNNRNEYHSQVVQGSDVFVWDNVWWKSQEVNYQVSFDWFGAGGQILRNGTVYGTFHSTGDRHDAGTMVQIYAMLPDGKWVLKSFRKAAQGQSCNLSADCISNHCFDGQCRP